MQTTGKTSYIAERSQILSTAALPLAYSLLLYIQRYSFPECICVCTCCVESLSAAVVALTLLLCKVCVSIRLLCSSALMICWPQMARACSQAILIRGTRITSSHTCPTLQCRRNTDTQLFKSIDEEKTTALHKIFIFWLWSSVGPV